MYDFHYNYIKSRYNNKAKLLFTDTVFVMRLRQGMFIRNFDNSDYPKDSPYFSVENKKVIGKFKDEAAGIPIVEFIGLRSKMYSYVKNNDNNNKDS